MRRLLVIALLLVSSGAQAMGTSVSLTLVAWNADGSAALMLRHTSNDGDTSDSYIIVGSGTDTSASVSMRRYAGDGVSTQEVDRESCVDASQGLQTAMSRRKFRAVWIHLDRCRQLDRGGIVTIGPAARQRVLRSRVALPLANAASGRANAVAAVVKRALPDLVLPLPVEEGGPVLEAFASTDRLIVLLFTVGGGSPERTVGKLFVKTDTEYTQLDDL